MFRTHTALVVCTLSWVALAVVPAQRAAEPPRDALADAYAGHIRPLLTQYCHRCHCDERAEGDINLSQFVTLSDVTKATRAWQKVSEMIDSGQMPPRTARQPSVEDRARMGAWVRAFLKRQAQAHAGDPGQVVLRRLSNAEYTYTVRDLTGVGSLEPAREFPVDGAAGEGFTNTGNALVMSPTLLTKYLDAGKGIASHVVLLPDGIRFSRHTTRRDQTNEVLDQIRSFYGRHADPSGGTQIKLHGLVWDAKDGGRLPVEKYVRATLEEREALASGRKTIAGVAGERGLSEKYLGLLWQALREEKSSLLLDELRERWRGAGPGDAAAITAMIVQWQNALWKFNSIGHIGRVGGPKAWLEAVDPVTAKHDIQWKVPAAGKGEAVFYLVAGDNGDGNEHDYVVWQQPRFVAPGKPNLLLRDVRAMSLALAAMRKEVLRDTAKYLLAVDEASSTNDKPDVGALARRHGLDADALAAWLDHLGVGPSGPVKVEGHFTSKISNTANYAFVRGWGSNDTPNLVANSSDQHVRIPGNLKPHGVAVHPSPRLNALVGWQSPISGVVRIEAKVSHAHPECGNGVTWAVEHRSGSARQRLASGTAQGQKAPTIEPIAKLSVQPGDLISLVIGPRDGNHFCDLTAVDLTVTAEKQTWDLARDVSSDVHKGNPHGTWHFYTEPVTTSAGSGFVIPSGSLLDQWRSAKTKGEKAKLAAALERLLTSPPPATDTPDGTLHRQLESLSGPLFNRLRRPENKPNQSTVKSTWGLDPALFGRHPNGGGGVDTTSLCVKAPSVVEVRVPAELVAGYTLVTSGVLHADARGEGSVQLQVLAARPETDPPIRPGVPTLVAEAGPARARIASELDQFRKLFPTAVCYTKIVPVDEVVTLTLFYREDDHLKRLMLNEDECKQIDRLWEELYYISQEPLALVVAYEQIAEFATQDRPDLVKAFAPLRKPIHDRADAFRQRLRGTEPGHVDAVLDFAARAYRRPLTESEKDDLRALYRRLRDQGLPHEQTVRLTIARVLVAPAFLYKLEQPGPGAEPVSVSDWELASRLSYFLWSSAPDDELRQLAAAGKLRDPEVLVVQMKRMLQDDRVRRLAIEFGCQWLHVRGFDELNEKSERHFPTFAGLRADMYEETVLFFTDLFQNDRTVLNILDADHTFLNEPLAMHYGIPGIKGTSWRRVEGVQKHGRGGILGLATTLATQSGASRTSPILRGNWISEVLLGEKLPRPPKGVPQLPDDETATAGLTVRQLVERHSSDPSCAVCHKRIDAYGFALEGFDAIGRLRDRDLANRPIDTRVSAPDGTEFDGIAGLRGYLLTRKKDVFVRQFCKKLLGYALGRAAQLSDEPLLDEIQAALEKNDYRIRVAVEMIVRSKQFREIRGKEYVADE